MLPGDNFCSSVAMAWRRSVSLTRSSPAPVMIVSPSANSAATASTGISSISRGIISAPKETPCRGAASTRRSATHSPPLSRSFCTEICAPISLSTSSIPVRVGLIPTLFRRRRLPAMIVPATRKYAAELMSPGTVISLGAWKLSSSTGKTVTLVPLRSRWTPKPVSICSVWSREMYGSVTVVGASA